MDGAFLPALIAVLLVSLISLAGLATLGMNTKLLRTALPFLVSLAVGALFGDALIHLIPHALAEVPGETTVPFFVLLGIVLFFTLEKFLRWNHSHDLPGELAVDLEHGGHDHHHDHPIKPVGPIVLFGDGLHNFIDGVIIGAGFLVSPEVGIATTIAIALHEIPQEIGDFAILLHAGFSKKKALLFNFFSALSSVLGLILVFLLADVEHMVPLLSAIAAGGFIYIAGSDLVPELHEENTTSKSIQQLVAILIGIGLMFVLLEFESGHGHDHDHDHHDHDDHGALIVPMDSLDPRIRSYRHYSAIQTE